MSFQLEVVRFILKVINGKKMLSADILEPKRNLKEFDTERYSKGISVHHTLINGFPLITLIPESPGGKHLLFFHGGSYVLEASAAHRRIAETLCLKYGMTVTLLDYPLGPENNQRITFRYLEDAYHYLLVKYSQEELLFFGDDAGGGLALAFLQHLRLSDFRPLPAGTVLLSPWLDVSMSNQEIDSFEKKDPVLSKRALLNAARKYADVLDLRNSKVSPIFGPMDHLGDVLMLFGTNELFYPDCMVLKEKLEAAAKTNVETIIYKGAIHDWILYPVPERAQAIEQMANWMLKRNYVKPIYEES
jgi:acetyl esterase/lipase